MILSVRNMVIAFVFASALSACGVHGSSSGSAQAYEGSWYWENGDEAQSFFLKLHVSGDSISGTCCNSFRRIRSYECPADSTLVFGGHATDSGMLVMLAGSEQRALLSLQSGGIRWKVLGKPAGGINVPASALLSQEPLH